MSFKTLETGVEDQVDVIEVGNTTKEGRRPMFEIIGTANRSNESRMTTAEGTATLSTSHYTTTLPS